MTRTVPSSCRLTDRHGPAPQTLAGVAGGDVAGSASLPVYFLPRWLTSPVRVSRESCQTARNAARAGSAPSSFAVIVAMRDARQECSATDSGCCTPAIHHPVRAVFFSVPASYRKRATAVRSSNTVATAAGCRSHCLPRWAAAAECQRKRLVARGSRCCRRDTWWGVGGSLESPLHTWLRSGETENGGLRPCGLSRGSVKGRHRFPSTSATRYATPPRPSRRDSLRRPSACPPAAAPETTMTRGARVRAMRPP